MSRNQINQPLILPHPGIILPPSGLTVSPYEHSTNLFPALSMISPQPVLSSPMSASPSSYPDERLRYPTPSLTSKSPISPSSTSILSTSKYFRIISWEELKKLFTEHEPDGRVESGLLSDGRAYAQKTARRENYFLFPSKSAYILYFIHYYFSCENLDRDQTFRRMMIESTAVSVEKLIQAPRLASIGTTPLDLQFAIGNSNILCLVDLPDGNRGVRRIDGYPGNFSSSDTIATSTSEIKRDTSFEKHSWSDQPLSPAFNQSYVPVERNFVTTSIGELPTYLTFNDALVTKDNISCNNSSEFDSARLSSPFTGPPYPIGSSPSQKNSLQVSPGNYPSSVAQELSPVVVSSFQGSPAIPFSVQSAMQTQGLLLPYGSTYSVPIQSASCNFPQQVSLGNFVARSPRAAYPISFDAALSAFLTLSGNNGGQAFAHHVAGNGTMQSPPNMHFYYPQISNGSHSNLNHQLNPYSNILTPPNSAMNAQNQNANVHQDAFSTLANLTQYYQQQRIPRVAAPFHSGQQLFPHQMNLQTCSRNTPPPSQPSYFQLAANQLMHACNPQNSQPQFYSALPVTFAPAFSFATPTVEGGCSGFRSQLPSQPFLQDTVMPQAWNSSETLTAATTGINLQYAGPPHLSALVGGLPLAFDTLSLNGGRTPAILQQSVNSSFFPMSMKTPISDSQGPPISPPVSAVVSTPNLVEVHPCAVDDPSIVAVTDSGDGIGNSSSSINPHENEMGMDGDSEKNSLSHTSINVKEKKNWQPKFYQPQNSVLNNNISSLLSPIPFFPTSSEDRPQSVSGLPASDLFDISVLKTKDIRLVNDLGISLHSNPD